MCNTLFNCDKNIIIIMEKIHIFDNVTLIQWLFSIFNDDFWSNYRIRGDVPIPSDRYRVQMRGNVVQLTLKQSQKDDTGHYALVATRVGQGFEKGSSKKIHLSVDEAISEEGDPPIFLRRLTDLAVKVGTRTRFLVEIRSSTTPKVIIN